MPIPRSACGHSSQLAVERRRGRGRGGRARSSTSLARSAEPADRRAAAVALGSRDVVAADSARAHRAPRRPRPDGARRGARCRGARAMPDEPEVVRRVVAAIEEPRTAGSATAALRRLGDAGRPVPARRARPRRRVKAAAARARRGRSRPRSTASTIIAPALRDPDRAVVLVALEALDAAGGSRRRAARAPRRRLPRRRRARGARSRRPCVARARRGSLHRALEDEIELARRLVIAVLALRHGDRVRDGRSGRRLRGRPAPRARSRGARRDPLARGGRRSRFRSCAREHRTSRLAASAAAVGARRGAVDRGHRRRSGRRLALVVARRVRTTRGRPMTTAAFFGPRAGLDSRAGCGRASGRSRDSG